VGLTLKADDSYVFSLMQVTGAASADAEIEKGTYVADGKSLTMTPKEWSCPGPSGPSTVMYTMSGKNLVLSDSSGVISFSPNAAPSGSIAIRIGCFDNGTFTPRPLAPLGN
jgi:hypothetical protein